MIFTATLYSQRHVIGSSKGQYFTGMRFRSSGHGICHAVLKGSLLLFLLHVVVQFGEFGITRGQQLSLPMIVVGLLMIALSARRR